MEEEKDTSKKETWDEKRDRCQKYILGIIFYLLPALMVILVDYVLVR